MVKVQMIILDKAPVSTDMWYWFSERASARVKKIPESIPVGEPLVMLFARENANLDEEEDDERLRWPRDYRRLNLPQFWDIFSEVFMICTGIFHQGVSSRFAPEDVCRELKVVVDVATWWAVVEDVPVEIFADFDYKEIDLEGKRVKQTLRYKIYYMCQVIEGAMEDLRKSNYRPNEMNVGGGAFDTSGDSTKAEMEAIIREKSKGDLDEFILYAIQSLQFRTMGAHHNKLAQLVRYIAFNEKEFDNLLPPCEIWRLLFSDYFDGVEDYFNRFYNKYTNECVLYFLSDYLADDYGIKMIPIYKLFTKGGQVASTKVCSLVDVGTVKRDIVKVEAKYRMT